jgi:hypothetical protein
MVTRLICIGMGRIYGFIYRTFHMAIVATELEELSSASLELLQWGKGYHLSERPLAAFQERVIYPLASLSDTLAEVPSPSLIWLIKYCAPSWSVVWQMQI